MFLNKVEICGVNTSELPLLSDEEKENLFIQIEQGNMDAREQVMGYTQFLKRYWARENGITLYKDPENHGGPWGRYEEISDGSFEENIVKQCGTRGTKLIKCISDLSERLKAMAPFSCSLVLIRQKHHQQTCRSPLTTENRLVACQKQRGCTSENGELYILNR